MAAFLGLFLGSILGLSSLAGAEMVCVISSKGISKIDASRDDAGRERNLESNENLIFSDAKLDDCPLVIAKSVDGGKNDHFQIKESSDKECIYESVRRAGRNYPFSHWVDRIRCTRNNS